MGDRARAVLGPLRTLISVLFLAVVLWAAFTVRLGSRTFADHVDRIGQTPEAQDFLDGTRSRITPALESAKQRILGEYVEAPTSAVKPPPPAKSAKSSKSSPAPGGSLKSTHIATQASADDREVPSTAAASKLPGRGRRAKSHSTPDQAR